MLICLHLPTDCFMKISLQLMSSLSTFCSMYVTVPCYVAAHCASRIKPADHECLKTETTKVLCKPFHHQLLACILVVIYIGHALLIHKNICSIGEGVDGIDRYFACVSTKSGYRWCVCQNNISSARSCNSFTCWFPAFYLQQIPSPTFISNISRSSSYAEFF